MFPVGEREVGLRGRMGGEEEREEERDEKKDGGRGREGKGIEERGREKG